MRGLRQIALGNGLRLVNLWPMQRSSSRHWLRTLVPAGGSYPAAEAPDRVAPRSVLRQLATTYTAGVFATLAFIA